jgi:hypothetical protein
VALQALYLRRHHVVFRRGVTMTSVFIIVGGSTFMTDILGSLPSVILTWKLTAGGWKTVVDEVVFRCFWKQANSVEPLLDTRLCNMSHR